MTPHTSRSLYLFAAVLVAVMTCIFALWRYGSGVFLSTEVLRRYDFVMAILVISWVVADPAIPAFQRPSFDHGMFVWATFPFLAAYHLYSTQGWRGIIIVAGLLGLFIAPETALALAQAVGQ